MLPQPDVTTCGPTCLHAVYRYLGLDLPLDQIIRETQSLEGGGTLGVLLGIDALKRGFRVTNYTYNLHMFDPSWFSLSRGELDEKLAEQLKVKASSRKFTRATKAYREFLQLGGNIRLEDLTPRLIRSWLVKGVPILTGLSATYLYQSRREIQSTMVEDDLLGTPTGHFVVVHGYDKQKKAALVADPDPQAPYSGKHHRYEVAVDRLISAILLGIITYDANFLVIENAG